MTQESKAKRLVAATRRYLRGYARIHEQQRRAIDSHHAALNRAEQDHGYYGWLRTSEQITKLNEKMHAHVVACPTSVRDFILQPREDADGPDDLMFNAVGEAMYAQALAEIGGEDWEFSE